MIYWMMIIYWMIMDELINYDHLSAPRIGPMLITNHAAPTNGILRGNILMNMNIVQNVIMDIIHIHFYMVRSFMTMNKHYH